MDKKYQMLLEHALYSEFSFALGIPANRMTQFIAEHTKREESETKAENKRGRKRNLRKSRVHDILLLILIYRRSIFYGRRPCG